MGVIRHSVTVVFDTTFIALDFARITDTGAIDSKQVITSEHGPVLKNLPTLQSGKNFCEAGT